MATAISAKVSARDRLLAAADELFYNEGVNTVGIDRVIEQAGVAKASLYSTFGSKEELVRAYLKQRQDERAERLERAMAKHDNPREKILAIFDSLGEAARKSTFRGCAFINASAESRPGSAVEAVSDEARAWVRSLFVDLARQVGVANPTRLGRELALVYDGAVVSARMDRDAKAPQVAKTIAALMVDNATKG